MTTKIYRIEDVSIEKNISDTEKTYYESLPTIRHRVVICDLETKAGKLVSSILEDLINED